MWGGDKLHSNLVCLYIVSYSVTVLCIVISANLGYFCVLMYQFSAYCSMKVDENIALEAHCSCKL